MKRASKKREAEAVGRSPAPDCSAPRQFRLVRDEYGFVQAIAEGDWYLIHLECGTVRNEENAEKLLAVLNEAAKSAHYDMGIDMYRNLQRAVAEFRSNAEHEPRAVASRAPCSCSAGTKETR